jgi:O-antigen ligase
MSVRKALASLAALGLVLAGVAAVPAFAQEEEVDDASLWLLGGFFVSEAILVTILASDDDIEIIPDPEPTPVSP